MLVVVIAVGLLYALPNLYGEDPAVQITGARGVAASEQTLIQVQKTLQEEKIDAKSVALENGAILARFDSTDVQLRAREALVAQLGDQFVVALNLAPATALAERSQRRTHETGSRPAWRRALPDGSGHGHRAWQTPGTEYRQPA
jgi:xanthosine utilization system XapX-like protein